MSTEKSRTATGAKVQVVAWPTVVFFVMLAALFLFERTVSGEQAVRILDLLCMAGMAGTLVTILSRRAAAKEEGERTAYSFLLISGLWVFLGVVIFLVLASRSTKVADSLKSVFGKNYEGARDFLGVLWPSLVVLGGLPMAFIQRALSGMTDDRGEAEHIDLSRVRYSAQAGVTVALVMVFCAAVNYVASERNVKYDFARFRSTRPSEVTKKVVANLSKTMKAVLFFPSPNDVREQVVPYFEDLAKQSPKFTYEVLDHALEPEQARKLSATGNGLIIIGAVDDKGQLTTREMLNIGTTMELAQSPLSTFDGDVQKKILTLSRPGRIAYFTTGHGERGFDSGGFFDLQKDDLRAPVGYLRNMMQQLGYEVRTLSVGQGLASAVPADAGLVIIAGATEHFLPEEVTALKTYLLGGGHMYLMFDPGAETVAKELAPITELVGVKYNPQVLCNDEAFVPRTHKAGDKVNIVSMSFSSHVSVTALSKASGRVGVIVPKTGWFERLGAAPPGVQLDFTLRSMPQTYVDTNGNFTRDSGEKQQVFDLAAVAWKNVGEPASGSKGSRDLRIAILGSADAVSDLALPNRANTALALDAVKWLMSEEAIVGETVQETDAPIVHTKDQDKLWFYSTIVAAPAAVLILGLMYVRRVRRRRTR